MPFASASRVCPAARASATGAGPKDSAISAQLRMDAASGSSPAARACASACCAAAAVSAACPRIQCMLASRSPAHARPTSSPLVRTRCVRRRRAPPLAVRRTAPRAARPFPSPHGRAPGSADLRMTLSSPAAAMRFGSASGRDERVHGWQTVDSSRWGSPSGKSSAARWNRPQLRRGHRAPRRRAPPAASLCRRPPRELVQPRIGAVELGPVSVGALEVVARRSRPARRALRACRASRQRPRGARLASPWGASRRRRRGSGGGGSGMPPRRGRWAGPGGSAPCARARGGGSATSSRSAIGASSCTVPRWKTCPSTAPRPIMSRSLRPEPVEPGLQERLDRRGHDDLALAAVLAHHREHLLDEERVAAGGGEDPRRAVLGDRGPPPRREMSSLAVLRGERLEQDRRRVELAAAPAGPQLEQLRAGDAEQEDRGVARPVGDVLDQIEEDGLGPLDVVEHDDLRPLGRAAPRAASGRRAACRPARCRSRRRARRRSRAGSRRAASR